MTMAESVYGRVPSGAVGGPLGGPSSRSAQPSQPGLAWPSPRRESREPGCRARPSPAAARVPAILSVVREAHLMSRAPADPAPPGNLGRHPRAWATAPRA